MLKEVYKEAEDKMAKVIETTQHEFATVRTGRATPTILDHIRVDCYGSQLPVNQLATISIPEPRMILISPWDKAANEAICKAIIKSDLSLTPNTDGNVIRISIPTLTEERRKELDKVIKKKAEDGRIAIRNIRHKINDMIKEKEKSKEISEDESKHAHIEVQKTTDKFIEKIDHCLMNKEKEILEG
ncbi:MAG: ribosome recycling factor [Nitrospirota bacterium]